MAEGAGVEPASWESESQVPTVIPTLNFAAGDFKPTGGDAFLYSPDVRPLRHRVSSSCRIPALAAKAGAIPVHRSAPYRLVRKSP